MSAAEIRAWTRANLRARRSYDAHPIAACLGFVTSREGIEQPCNGIGDGPDHLCPKCRPAAPASRRCPACGRSHTGASRTCGACRQRKWRAAKKVAKKVSGPQMERRYWLTEQGYAALAQLDEEPR